MLEEPKGKSQDAHDVLTHKMELPTTSRNELQRERKAISQARSILWLGGFPGRTLTSVSEDEINRDSQETKQHDEDQIDEACPLVGNDHHHQHKNKDQRK